MHPTRLLRADSSITAENQFSAPRNVDLGFANYDCGIVRLPWLAHRLKLHKYNTVRVYLTLFGLLGLLHGCCTSYFAGTSSVWRHNYRLSETYVEWIVYSSPIIGGLFAILIAYWGNRIHRVTWLGGLAMLQSVAGCILLMPETYHPRFSQLNSTQVFAERGLCKEFNPSGPSRITYSDEKRTIAIAFMFIYQLFHSFAYVSLICHGLSYIDDYYLKKIRSLRAVCLVVAIHEIGKCIGNSLTLIPSLYNVYIFLSPVWILMMVFIFISGFLISLFPKVMLSLVMRRGVNRLLNGFAPADHEKPIKFWPAFKSLINPVLLLITFAAALMTSATNNFQALREDFFKARFIDTSDDIFAYENFTQYIVKLTFHCMLVLLLAILITKYKPRIQSLMTIMIVGYAIVALLFASYAFIECEDKITMEYKLLGQSCNYNCHCDSEIFAPVCGSGKTYFSGCFAGCTYKQDNIYKNCSCIATREATDGSCNQDKCISLWFFSKANNTITAGICLVVTILHLLIILRSVDMGETKAISLGLYMTGTQFVPYVPFKFIFNAIRDWGCVNTNVDGLCTSYQQMFPAYLSALTVSLMTLSVICTIILRCYVKDIDLSRGVLSKSCEETTGRTVIDDNDDADDDRKMIPLKALDVRHGSLEMLRPARPKVVVFKETAI